MDKFDLMVLQTKQINGLNLRINRGAIHFLVHKCQFLFLLQLQPIHSSIYIHAKINRGILHINKNVTRNLSTVSKTQMFQKT